LDELEAAGLATDRAAVRPGTALILAVIGSRHFEIARVAGPFGAPRPARLAPRWRCGAA
jgi:hypothetical protein